MKYIKENMLKRKKFIAGTLLLLLIIEESLLHYDNDPT
jgi:hypothetical protein